MKFNPTALALFLCSAQQAMLRSTVASFAVTRAIARKNGVTHNTNRAMSSAGKMMGARGERVCGVNWLSNDNDQQSCPAALGPRLGPLYSHSKKYHPGWMLVRGGAATSAERSMSTSATALNSAVASEAETAEAAPVEVFRTDYKPLPHLVTKINMDFDIQSGKTIVTSELFIEPNQKAQEEGLAKPTDDLVLDGDESCVKLLSVSVDGKELEQGKDYQLAPGKMIVKSPKPGTVLKTVVEIVPEENTQLSGLYKSGPMYCTQVSQQ